MDKVKLEYGGLVTITAIGFSLNLLFGLIGRFAFDPVSYQQLLCYQLADVSAITASLMLARDGGSLSCRLDNYQDCGISHPQLGRVIRYNLLRYTQCMAAKVFPLLPLTQKAPTQSRGFFL